MVRGCFFCDPLGAGQGGVFWMGVFSKLVKSRDYSIMATSSWEMHKTEKGFSEMVRLSYLGGDVPFLCFIQPSKQVLPHEIDKQPVQLR